MIKIKKYKIDKKIFFFFENEYDRFWRKREQKKVMKFKR